MFSPTPISDQVASLFKLGWIFFFAVFFCPAQSCRVLTAFYSGDRSIFLHGGHSSIDVQSQSKIEIIQMKGLREVVLWALGGFGISETIQQ